MSEPAPISADLATGATALALRALDAAPTLLENLFWGMVLGFPHAGEQYLDELLASDLPGYGNVPDDFPGEVDTE